MSLATLFGKLQEHQMELMRLNQHEENDKKKKGIAPESNSTSKGIPLMKHLPWIISLDFEASMPLRVNTFPVAFRHPVWSFRPPPFHSFLGSGQSL